MLILDRFEGDWAVIENDDRNTFNLPRSLLPTEAREGDVITLIAQIDKEATEERKKQAGSMIKFDD